MRVLMFGWEFPPMNSGGLGTACYGLTKGLSSLGVHVLMVLPRLPEDTSSGFLEFVDAHVHLLPVSSPLRGYMSFVQAGGSLHEEVLRYAAEAKKIALSSEFDVIHAHDWLTYLAGVEAKKVSGKPLVVHVHATEFDRTGGSQGHPFVSFVEKYGMEQADQVITVSDLTRKKVIESYAIPSEKITVVHNAVSPIPLFSPLSSLPFEHVVLFLGRLTVQKGADYFLRAAQKVLMYEPHTRFILAGSGDMLDQLHDMVYHLGLIDHVLFTGFLRGEALAHVYQMASVYVMPSVSEPFGLTPLEALQYGTPVIISKQSGVAEILPHCLKVDFWDVDTLAEQILSVLRYAPLRQTLASEGGKLVASLDWSQPAKQCLTLYQEVLLHG